MTLRTKKLVIVAAAIAILTGACGHKLVAEPGQHTVRIYPDKEVYQRLHDLENTLKKHPSPFGGMVAGMGQQLLTKEVPSDTPVNILAQDSLGALVEVASGPKKGIRGYVPSANLK